MFRVRLVIACLHLTPFQCYGQQDRKAHEAARPAALHISRSATCCIWAEILQQQQLKLPTQLASALRRFRLSLSSRSAYSSFVSFVCAGGVAARRYGPEAGLREAFRKSGMIEHVYISMHKLSFQGSSGTVSIQAANRGSGFRVFFPSGLVHITSAFSGAPRGLKRFVFDCRLRAFGLYFCCQCCDCKIPSV